MKSSAAAYAALLEAAKEVSRVAGAADLQALMHSMLDKAIGLMGAERGMLVLLEGNQHRLAAWRSSEADDESDIELSRSLLQRVIERGEPVLTTNAQEDPRFEAQMSIMAFNIRSVLATPLRTAQGILGALYLDTRFGTRIFEDGDLELLTAFAGLTASALELVRSVEVRKAMYLQSVLALVNAVEAKDPYTAGHSSRVGLYAQGIAKVLGWSDLETEQALIGGYLHDVGKIGISDAHVRKPGPLNAEEWEEFKKHPEIGERILSGSEVLQPILPAVRWHHERLDGSGYPDGLQGTQIPILPRIIGVADAFDAMTTDRPYRKSPGKAYALSELQRLVGVHYDPVILEAFVQALERGWVQYDGLP